MDLIIPKKLNKGDTVGVVSPSAGLANIFPHRVRQGVQALEKLGFKVVFAPNSLKRDGYVSGTPRERADDLHAMFADLNIKAIICTIGGNHSNQILKYLDFELIKKNPKIFIGYSDITILHYAFAKKAKLRTFYGPCLMPEFGEYPEILDYTREYFERAVANEETIGIIGSSETWTDEFLDWEEKKDRERPRNLFSNEGYEWWREGEAKGEIFGGAIPTINHLAGTEYWVDPKGKIFFIDIPEGDVPGKAFFLSWLDSFLSDLDNLNVFSSIKGLVIGRPYAYTKQDSQWLKERILFYTAGQKYPIIYNVNIGHVTPIITVPMGAMAQLDSSKNAFTILESGVSVKIKRPHNDV